MRLSYRSTLTFILPACVLPLCFICYETFYFFRLYFPYPETIIHPKMSRPPSLFPKRLNAHRGGSHERSENTLGSYAYCIDELHLDMIESDCILTKDKVPIIFHDRAFTRLTGLNQTVRKTNYEDIPPLLNSYLLQNYY